MLTQAAILAGPILRYCDAMESRVWFASSKPLNEEFLIKSSRLIRNNNELSAEFFCNSISIGRSLFFYLITIKSSFQDSLEEKGSPPKREAPIYVIPVSFSFAAAPAIYELIRGAIPVLEENRASKILSASCLKLHGKGKFPIADAVGGVNCNQKFDTTFLVGDQVYADDVDSITFTRVLEIANELSGGKNILRHTQLTDRKKILEAAKLTTDADGMHCFTFHEYASLYCISWNPRIWSKAQQSSNIEGLKAAQILSEEIFPFNATYMMFDDHDVSDDWNIDQKWMQQANEKNSILAEIVANALCAYILFQDWGNHSKSVTDSEKYLGRLNAVVAHIANQQIRGEHRKNVFESLKAIIDDGFGFIAPTTPPSIFLDCRTQRTPTNIETCYSVKVGKRFSASTRRLYNFLGRPTRPSSDIKLFDSRSLEHLLEKIGPRLKSGVYIVTGTPVFPPNHVYVSATAAASPATLNSSVVSLISPVFSVVRKRMHKLANLTLDSESFPASPESFLEFWRILQKHEAKKITIISGDIHIGHIKKMTLIPLKGENSPSNKMEIIQITTSPMLNSFQSGAPTTHAIDLGGGIYIRRDEPAKDAAVVGAACFFSRSKSVEFRLLCGGVDYLAGVFDTDTSIQDIKIEPFAIRSSDFGVLFEASSEGVGESEEKLTFENNMMTTSWGRGGVAIGLFTNGQTKEILLPIS